MKQKQTKPDVVFTSSNGIFSVQATEANTGEPLCVLLLEDSQGEHVVAMTTEQLSTFMSQLSAVLMRLNMKKTMQRNMKKASL